MNRLVDRPWKLVICVAAFVAAHPVAPNAGDREAEIQASVTAAWDDATATWQAVLGSDVYRADAPKINFVSAVKAAHCYGLYIGTGPVYCSGNTTVFVSIASIAELEKRVPAVSGAGLGFLVAHELGHHIQNRLGRFRLLNQLVRNDPARSREFALRFELEADCFAGVWASNSPKLAATEDARAAIIASLDALGDDKILAASGVVVDPLRFTHGSSRQRVSWFRRGLEQGAVADCNVMRAEEF